MMAHMQVRVSEYNQLKGQVNQQNRKATGSLAVRDLSGLVSSKDIISTENLVTLFVVVSKHSKLEWQSSYEKFCEFVVSQGLHLEAVITRRDTYYWSACGMQEHVGPAKSP